jgi:hypothetical protein
MKNNTPEREEKCSTDTLEKLEAIKTELSTLITTMNDARGSNVDPEKKTNGSAK